MTSQYKLNYLKQLVRLSYLLLVLALAANLWQQNQPPVIYLIVLLPLLMFAPGLWVNNLRTYIWMGFVLLLYFASAVFGVSKPQPTALDFAELVLSVVLFCTAMFYTRRTQVSLKD